MAKKALKGKAAAVTESASSTVEVEPPGAPSILSRLGVFGLDAVQPVVLGALISGEPFLLVGPHGTGKSYLLNRLCQALGLSSRHYNASLLNFDDLVGYPLPNEKRELEYVQTPSSIWGAQAVFLDEISRCRPDLQNKLFPIIYERRVQGLLLEDLQYRWAAMNPPASEDDDPDTCDAYFGSEPLDPALADRFSLLLSLPDFEDFTQQDQLNVILCKEGPVAEDAAAEIRRIVTSGRLVAESILKEQGAELATYIREVVGQLGRASITCSPRRAGILLRNVAAVHAAQLVTGGKPRLKDSAWLAVRHGLPNPASGQKTDEIRVLAAHREAWNVASLKEDSPVRLILQERDPVRRVLLACRLDKISRSDFTVVVSDALAELPHGARHAVAALLFEEDRAGKLTAAVAEEAAALYLVVTSPQDVQEEVRVHTHAYRGFTAVNVVLSEMLEDDPETVLLNNLLLHLWQLDEIHGEYENRRVVRSWQATREVLGRGKA